MKKQANTELYNNIFATRLRELMEETKTTQQALAKEINITRQAISQYTDGSVLPNIEKLEKISNYFNVSCDYLVGKVNIKTSNTSLQKIYELTGLIDDSINTLIYYKKSNTEYVTLINRILSHNANLEKLLEEIKNYRSITNSSEISDQITTFFEDKINKKTNKSALFEIFKEFSNTPEKFIDIYEESLKSKFIEFIKNL